MNPGKQAHLRTVLLATTALVGVVLIDGGSASAGQAAGCAPAGATAGTVTCAPQTDNYNPGGVSYQPTGPLMLSIAPGATVTGVTNFGASVQVSGPGAMFSPDPVDVNVSISNAGTLAPSNSNTFGSSGILGSVGADGSASTLQINNSGTINNATTGSPDVSGISASVTGNGAVTVTNSGQISAVQNAGNGSAGVEVGTSGAGTGTASVSVVNSGAISSISGDYGVSASSARGGITISNQGTITGSQVAITATTNNGGGGIVPLSVPAGTAAAGTILIDNAGRIVSTATNNPIAIQLGASNNTLLLEPGQSIVGAVQNGTVNPQGNGTVRITTGVNTLNLGGAGTDTFDVSQIGLTPTQQGLTQGANGQYNGTVAAAPTQQYQEFSSFVKSGSSTWILTYGTGGSLADQNWGVTGGTLQGDTTSIRGATITDGAALAFVQNFDGTYAGTVVDGAAPGALVKGGAGTLTLTGANTYTGGTFFSGGAILATADANLGGAAGGFTFDGGALRYGASFDPATTRAITLNAGGGTLDTNGFNSTVGSTIAGPGALTKLGAGTLTLTSANTYAGGTLLQAGTLAVGGGSALGTGRLAFNGGTLQAAANATLGNAVALNTAGTIDTQSFGLTATGVFSGPGALTKLGTGTLTLTGANTYAGGTLLQAGTLAVGGGSALGTGTLAFNGGTLQAAANATLGNAVALNTAGTIDTQSFGLTATGVFSGPGALTKLGTGTLTLTGANTYAGGTLLQAGTLAVGGGSALGTGTLAFNGGTLQAAANATLGNAVALNTAGTIDTQSFGLTATGAVSGPGALTKLGAGTLTLTGANTYAGGTLLQAGTLAIGGGSALGTGTLAFNGGALQAAADATLGNAVALNTAGTIDTQSFGLTATGVFSGPGALTKLGTGTLTLTGANTYAGGTLLQAGTLAVGGGSALGTGTLAFNGGMLQAAANATLGNAVALNTAGTIDTQSFGLTATGVFSGPGALTKLGTGTLTLTGANTYAGGTLLQAGTLAVGGGSALGTGTLAFNGGMLQAAANATLGNAVALNTAGTIDTQSFGLTATGVFSGPGALTKLGTGTLTLTGANTYAGGTLLKAGTLAIGDAGGLGIGTLSMRDGTTLAFTNSLSFANAVVFTGTADPTFDTGANAVTAGGSISGAGALTKQGSGMLVLTGVNTYTGGTTIAAGTLRGSATSFGTGAIADAGSLVIDQTANRSFANAISGTGSLVKTGAGTLTLTGESTLSGPTKVQSGGLAVQGSLGGSTVTIANGGTLSGTGRVGAIAAQGGAAVAPGTTTNPYGVLRVAGSVAFAQGSTFTVSIDPTGRNSAIAAGGTASLSGGTVAVQGGSGTYDPGTRYTLLTADKGISGAFSALSTTSNLAFLNPFLSYGANDVYLGFTRNQVAFLNVGITRNQRDTGTALQALGAGNPLYNAVLGLTASQARAAFDASSGEIHASAVTAGFEDTRLVREAILNRLQAAARDGVASRTDGAVASDLPPTFVPTAPYTLWGQGFGDFGYNGTDRNAATLERSLGGFVLGGDMSAPSSLGPWRFGVAGGYTEDTLTLDKRASSGTFQTAFGALYAGAQYGALDLKFGTSFGGTSTSTNRVTAFPGLRDGTTSNYDGAIVQGFGEAGYRFLIGNGMVEPLGTGAFIHIHQDGFREDGGPAALVGTARDYDLGTTTLGLKGEMPLMAGLPLYASGFLGWRHAFGDLTPGALLQFGAGTTPFEVFGAPVDRDALSAQVAVDYRATSAFTVGVSYSGQVGERAEDQAVRGRVQYRF